MQRAFTIRPARLEDHPQLRPLFAALDAYHVERAPWLLRSIESDPRPPAWLAARLADPTTTLLVAEADPGPDRRDPDADPCVGLATVRLTDPPDFPLFRPRKRALIDDLVVHPDWRRQGVAQALCAACEAWARDHGAAWIEVNVYAFNDEATALYERVGFETMTRRLRKPLQ